MDIPLVLVLAAVCSIPLASGEPDESKQFSSSSSNTVHSANGYFVSTSQTSDNGNCIEHITIKGPGIYKVTTIPCQKGQIHFINLEKTLLVGPFFSEKPSVLVEVTEKYCLQEVFHQKDGQWGSTASYLDPIECEKVKAKVEGLKELYQKWQNYYKEQQDKAQSQLQQLQINLQQLQQNLFGGIFGSFG